MAYIKDKSNYLLKKIHQLTNDGVIYERDITTVGGISSFGHGNTPIYRSGNFILTINGSKPPIIEYDKSNWLQNENSNEWTLNDLKPIEYCNDDYLNLTDICDIRDFAYYGSCSELIRVSLNNILSKFPGELYAPYENIDKNIGVKYQYLINDRFEYLNKYENNLGIKFEYVLENPFQIILHDVESNDKELGSFSNNGFLNYDFIDSDNNIKKIISWDVNVVSDNIKNNYIGYITIGLDDGSNRYVGVFIDNDCSIMYMVGNDMVNCHIRPKSKYYEDFKKNLDKFEYILFNSNSTNSKPTLFDIITENSYGYVNDLVNFILPIDNGGYNININSPSFSFYVNSLVKVGEFYDERFCDNLYRSMTHESIKNLDNTTEGDSHESYDKIHKTLRIFARFFDDIKLKIDDIKNQNILSYNSDINEKKIKTLIYNDGWEITKIQPFTFKNENGKLIFYKNENINIQSHNGEKYNIDSINNHFLRNLRLNSRNILRHKGTINGIKMMLGLLGLKDEKDYSISEYITLAKPIEDKFNNIKNDYLIKWYNSVKTINYGNEYYDDYTGLPVINVDENGKRMLYPYFKGSDFVDGNPYYQMYGGWIKQTPNIITKQGIIYDISNNTYPYKETLNNIRSVYDINQLLRLTKNDVFDGCIYKVDNIKNNHVIIDNIFYEIKSFDVDSTDIYVNFDLFVQNGSVKFGNNVYYNTIKVSNKKYFDDETLFDIYNLDSLENGYKINIVCKCNHNSLNFLFENDQYSDHNISILLNGVLYTMGGSVITPSNYFMLYDAENLYSIGEGGWFQIDGTSETFNAINNIYNEYQGNNPHCGNLSYDDGKEYMKYFAQLFKYSIDNNYFDDRCIDDYNSELNTIKSIGFTDIFDENGNYIKYNNSKINFSGYIYDNLNTKNIQKKYFTQNPSNIDGLYNSDCYFIEGEDTIYSYNNTDISYVDDISNTFTNEYNKNSVINNKCITININIKDDDYENIKFVDNCITPYLEQMLPSNAIINIVRKEINTFNFVLTYETTYENQTIALFNDNFDITQISEISIDGGDKIKPISNMVTFNEIGVHSVHFNVVETISNLSNMFNGCVNLTSFEIRNILLNNVLSFDYMFKDCINITSVNLNNIQTPKLNSTIGMFINCESLVNVSMNNFITNNLKIVNSMFENCINLSTFEFNNTWCNSIENMNRMFYNCFNMSSCSFDNASLLNLLTSEETFYGCVSLNDIDMSNLICDKLVNINSMFNGCSNIVSILLPYSNDYLDANGSIQTMKNTFANCNALETINLSYVNTNNTNDMTKTFYNCNSLTRIGFAYGVDNLTLFEDIFTGVGSNGVFVAYDKFDISSYAKISQPLIDLEWQLVNYISED